METVAHPAYYIVVLLAYQEYKINGKLLLLRHQAPALIRRRPLLYRVRQTRTGTMARKREATLAHEAEPTRLWPGVA
jgi:hypothetical protein